MVNNPAHTLRLVQGGSDDSLWEYVVVLAVDDVCNANDLWILRLALLNRTGVRGVAVMRGRGMVRVAYDPARTTPESLVAGLESDTAGYSARIVFTVRPASATE